MIPQNLENDLMVFMIYGSGITTNPKIQSLNVKCFPGFQWLFSVETNRGLVTSVWHIYMTGSYLVVALANRPCGKYVHQNVQWLLQSKKQLTYLGAQHCGSRKYGTWAKLGDLLVILTTLEKNICQAGV